MKLEIEVPEDISAAIQGSWEQMSRRLLETIAVEGYRRRELSRSQVRRMLGFSTRMEVDEFMKRAGVPFAYDARDLDADIEAHRRLGLLPERFGLPSGLRSPEARV